jgi:hypothetical protein
MTPADKNHIQIRCPSCSQKFKVGDELMGRMVECGACEHRFDVTEDVLTRSGKFYPGERNAATLSQFSRIPGPTLGMAASEPALPGPHLEKGYYSPITRVSMGRIVVGWIGVLVILTLVVLLWVKTPGSLGAQSLPNRLIAAATGGGVGLLMIAFANPRTLKKSVSIASVFAVVVLSMPFLFRMEVPEKAAPRLEESEENTAPPVDETLSEPTLDQLKEKIGIGPLEVEVRRLKESGSNKRAFGVWLRDMNESNKLSVRDYVVRASGGSASSIIYPREARDYLMVLTGFEGTLEDVAAIMKVIAIKQSLHPELDLVEGPLEKLTDKSSPAFYDLNKRELESIQLERVNRAVRRLSDAEPKIYREDITRQLISLLAVEQLDNYGDISKALLVWAENPEQARAVALVRLKRLHEEQKRVPADLVALLAKSKAKEAVPIVKQLWTKDSTSWEPLFGQFGEVAEPAVLEDFNDLEITLKHSAVRILGLAGTKKSIPVLESARTKGGTEINVLIENSIRQIESRG